MALLMSQTQTGGSSLPFNMAIFVSAFLPHSLDCGTITWTRSTVDNKLLGTHIHGRSCGTLCDEHGWEVDSRTSTEFEMVTAHQDTLDFPVELMLRYSPDTDKTQINIPSVHVRGRKEPYDFVNDRMMRFFDAATSREMTHRGGHHFPRFHEELVEFAEMVIEAAHMI
ncbi:hypothetical protein DL771_002492 [Monosporascus sp. 5C6A]|nr:hypothetical protein DL771_002492 [Monosporascus sp. 5C6A]